MVSKSFPAIGSATVESEVTSPGVMRLRASGQATHPQDTNRRFQSAVDMRVSVKGNRVAVISTSQQARAGSEEFASRIQQVIPILAMVRTRPDVASGAVRSLDMPGGSVQIGSRTAGNSVEVTAQRGQEFVGKFFLTRQGSGLRLDRFRVPSNENNVMLNFVSAGTSQLVDSSD